MRTAFALPAVWKRSTVIGFGLAALWFIGDFHWFEPETLPHYASIYLLMGLSTSVSLGIAFTLYERLYQPASARRELVGQFGMTLVALVPGLTLPLFIEGYLNDETLSLSELWSCYLYGAITAAMFLFHYANQKTVRDLAELKSRTVEARYELLKAQMQPHFLFNSLNSLAELIPQDSKAAEEMAQKLSDLYKLILQNSESRTATLASEVTIARRYLEIERLRFDDRLRFDFSLPLEAERLHLPSLLVQTLVENAVKHGIASSVEGGTVSLAVSRTNEGWYRMQISNTGEPYRAASLGVGLTNTLARLKLFYGDRHDFRILSDDRDRTVVSFLFSGEALA